MAGSRSFGSSGTAILYAVFHEYNLATNTSENNIQHLRFLFRFPCHFTNHFFLHAMMLKDTIFLNLKEDEKK